MATTKATTLAHRTIPTSVITSGTFADARIAASNVTQHEGSIDALASNPTVTLGSNATFPAGHILQVVSNNIFSQTDVQATTFNTADVIGNCQITPKKASSNILITASITAKVNLTGDYLYLDIYKDASDVTETANLSTKIGIAVQDSDHWSNLFITFLDTCAENSLTEKTYKVSGRIHGAGGQGYLGWTTVGTFQENITAWEIATND